MLRTSAVLLVVSGCGLYFGDPGAGSGSGSGSGSDEAVHRLTVDRHILAEGAIAGVDSDGAGKLWIAYAAPHPDGTTANPVTLVHWDPVTRSRYQTYGYTDLPNAVKGLAVVGDTVWLNYANGPTASGTGLVRVIDTHDGSIVKEIAMRDDTVELAAEGNDRVLLSNAFNDVSGLTIADESIPQSFTTSLFSTTQQGIAWRPGEIWVGSWYTQRFEVHDDVTGELLGSVDASMLPRQVAVIEDGLAFDGDELVVGVGEDLYWLKVD